MPYSGMDPGSGKWGCSRDEAKAMSFASGLKIKCIEWFTYTKILIILLSKWTMNRE